MLRGYFTFLYHPHHPLLKKDLVLNVFTHWGNNWLGISAIKFLPPPVAGDTDLEKSDVKNRCSPRQPWLPEDSMLCITESSR